MIPNWAAHLVVALGGAVALVHQTLWTRRLVDVLGAGGDTFARVVGAFFVGLSLGGAFAAWRPANPRHAWRRVAAAELAVGLLALPVLGSVFLADSFRDSLPLERHPTLAALLFVTPPAIAMGLVLPAALTALGPASGGISLYVANTAGGVFGVLATVTLLVPRLGLFASGLVGVGANLLLAGAAFVFSRSRSRSKEARTPRPRMPDIHAIRSSTARVLAFGSGFLTLALEVLLQHQTAQVTINAGHSGALVLAFVIAGLALAGAAASRIRFGSADGVRGLVAWAFLATALIAASEPFVFLAARPGLRFFAYGHPPSAYLLRVAALSSLVLLPVFVAGGLVFPLLLRQAAGRREPGREVALLLALNGLGGWIGAETAQGWLLPALGIWTSCCAVAAVALAGWMVVRGRSLLRSPVSSTLLMAGLAAVPAAALASRRLPQLTPEPGISVAEVRTSREGVVAAVHGGPGDWRIVYNNTYTLGGSRAQGNQERQALLPILLHGSARRVGILGFATGSTTAGATLDPAVEGIEAFELSESVIGLAGRHFAGFHRDVFHHPRVRIRHQDARIAALENPGRYDVVVGDLFLPWRTGEGRLFTREHFQAVRRSLRQGGVFCQWLPMFQLTRPQFEAILRTFRTEFPEVFLVRGDFYLDQPILGLVGGRTVGSLDWTAIAEACRRVRDAGGSRDALLRQPEGVAMTVLGPAPVPPGGPLNTLDGAWLEWDAGRNVMGLRQPWFVGIPLAEYVRDTARNGARWIPEDLRSAQDAGQFFLTLEVAARMGLPAKANLEAQIPTRMPTALLDDFQNDWRLWPSRVKPFTTPSAPAPRGASTP